MSGESERPRLRLVEWDFSKEDPPAVKTNGKAGTRKTPTRRKSAIDEEIDGPAMETRGSDLSRVKPFEWAWSQRLLLGYVNLLVGDEAAGKGTLLAWIIAQLSRGTLPGNLEGQPVRTIILGDEDGFDGIWTPRLHLAGADLGRVSTLPVDVYGDLVINRDADRLSEMLEAEDIRVVIFDQLLDNLGVGVDDYRSKEVREAVAPLRRVAADLHLCVLAGLHTNKSGAPTFRQRVAGTQAFNAMSRSSLYLGTHPADPDRRVLVRGKGNYSAPPPALEFEITGEKFRVGRYVIEQSLAVNMRESEITIEELLAVPKATQPESKAARARVLLQKLLSDGRWHDSGPITKQIAAELDMPIREARRASEQLKVRKKRTSTFPSQTLWRAR